MRCIYQQRDERRLFGGVGEGGLLGLFGWVTNSYMKMRFGYATLRGILKSRVLEDGDSGELGEQINNFVNLEITCWMVVYIYIGGCGGGSLVLD